MRQRLGRSDKTLNKLSDLGQAGGNRTDLLSERGQQCGLGATLTKAQPPGE